MTHTNLNLDCASPDCAGTTGTANQGPHKRPGTKWRSALGTLAGAPFRLHQYRNFHTEVVEDAIRAYDCGRCS